MTLLQHWWGAVTCPACYAAGLATGPNALRGLGPDRSHALGSAMTQAGSPDPRNDRICIMSSCLRQFGEALDSRLCGSRVSRLFEAFSAYHHGPGHASDLIGKRNGGDLDRPALHNMRKPEAPRPTTSASDWLITVSDAPPRST